MSCAESKPIAGQYSTLRAVRKRYAIFRIDTCFGQRREAHAAFVTERQATRPIAILPTCRRRANRVSWNRTA